MPTPPFHRISITPDTYTGQDLAHVLLDALQSHLEAIEAGSRPWDKYDPDPQDGKTQQDQYLQLLKDAYAALDYTLDHG